MHSLTELGINYAPPSDGSDNLLNKINPSPYDTIKIAGREDPNTEINRIQIVAIPSRQDSGAANMLWVYDAERSIENSSIWVANQTTGKPILSNRVNEYTFNVFIENTVSGLHPGRRAFAWFV